MLVSNDFIVPNTGVPILSQTVLLKEEEEEEFSQVEPSLILFIDGITVDTNRMHCLIKIYLLNESCWNI